MTLRIAALFGLLVACVIANAQEPEPPSRARIYKTPQAAFDGFWAALKKQDFRTVIEALAPEAQKHAAIEFASQAIQARDGRRDPLLKDGETDQERKKRYAPVFAVMDKYGLTEKATKDLPRGGPGGPKKFRDELSKRIKKPEVFALEMIQALSKAEPQRFGGKRAEPQVKLADVKIDGAKATASMVHTFEFPGKGKDGIERSEHRQPVEFVKVNGGWRINPEAGRKSDDAPRPKEPPKEK